MSGIALGAQGDLLVGDDTGDDAAVYKLNADTALIFTVDFITPLVNDAFLVGQVAAANSISDVYAMGGKPILALNVCCFPQEGVPKEDLNAILKGGMDIAQKAGCLVVGGHTVKDQELKYGMAVLGTVHPDRVKRNSTPRVGDKIILTKPIGSGVIVGGAKAGMVPQEAILNACRTMIQLNDGGAAVAQEYDASALTDVTGFGLGGHALGMVKGGKVGYRLYASQIPIFPETLDLIRRGARTGVTMSNFETIKPYLKAVEGVAQEYVALLCDPQTAGGLIMPVAPDKADQALEALRAKGYERAAVIGEVYDTGGKPEITLER
jgi:selenide, water dikinase